MADEDSVGQEIEDLRRLGERFSGRSRPSKMELEEALAQGFARLMSLEAELARARVRQAGEPQLEELTERIETLRAALTQLLERTGSAGSARLAGGFVLPQDS